MTDKLNHEQEIRAENLRILGSIVGERVSGVVVGEYGVEILVGDRRLTIGPTNTEGVCVGEAK